MSTTNDLPSPAINAALSCSLADRIADLGSISASRIRSDPPSGTATVDDLLRFQAANGLLYELIDRTLVEKAMGWQESLLAAVLVQWLRNFLDDHDLGVVTGPDGLSQLFEGTVRSPDVAFISWQNIPDGQLPTEPIPAIVPDLAIEILSLGNTRSEMARKRREYFQAGVRTVWMIDPRSRTVAVFTSADDVVVLAEDETINANDVLPGWTVQLAKLWAELDRKAP